jgi:hypothetical protein
LFFSSTEVKVEEVLLFHGQLGLSANAAAAVSAGPLARFKEAAAASGDAGDGDLTGSGDLRTLPVRYDPSGDRWRDFDNVIEQTAYVEFRDFPKPGPRTLKWWLKHMKGKGGPLVRSTTWKSQARVPDGDRATHEHAMISEVLELMASYDQLNLGALASAELLVRRLQLIEAAHMHNPGNPDYTGSRFFMGDTGIYQGSLVDPALTEHVSERLKQDSKVMKERRLAREEQSLRSKKKGAGKGEKDGE